MTRCCDVPNPLMAAITSSSVRYRIVLLQMLLNCEKKHTKDVIKNMNLSKVPSFGRDIECLFCLVFLCLSDYEAAFKG